MSQILLWFVLIVFIVTIYRFKDLHKARYEEAQLVITEYISKNKELEEDIVKLRQESELETSDMPRLTTEENQAMKRLKEELDELKQERDLLKIENTGLGDSNKELNEKVIKLEDDLISVEMTSDGEAELKKTIGIVTT